MAEEDENNEAIDAIFAQGGDLTDILMGDIMSAAIKDDDTNLTGDEDLSQDNIDVPGVGGPETKLTDILGPGFNLDDVADIMKNLPEDSTEDSQDSTVSTAAPSANTKDSMESASSTGTRSEGNTTGASPTVSSAGPTTVSVPVTKESPLAPPAVPPAVPPTVAPSVPPVVPPATLPAASTLRPNQPPVAPLGSVPTVPQHAVGPPVQQMSAPAVPMPSAVQGTNAIPSMKNPTALPSPVGLQSAVSHQSPVPHQSPAHPSPIAVGPPPIPQSLPSPLPRSDSQPGYPQSQSSFPATPKPTTPTVPEPQKVWTSNDSQSQSLTLEEDEALGHKATKAAVLYVNIHKPNLKNDFPCKLIIMNRLIGR